MIKNTSSAYIHAAYAEHRAPTIRRTMASKQKRDKRKGARAKKIVKEASVRQYVACVLRNAQVRGYTGNYCDRADVADVKCEILYVPIL